MATEYSGVIYGGYSNYTRLRLNYTVSQDETTAISTITMNLYAERTKGSSQYNNSGQAYWNMTGTGNNSMTFNWSSSSLEMYLGSSSTTVQHNDEGVGAITLSGYWYTGRTGSSYIPEAISVSEYIVLQTIPRASSVSGGTGNIGSTSTISVSRASSSFTHTLRYAFGSLSGTIATGVGTSYTWTIPTSFYAQIPSAKSGTGTIYCDTYSGNTLIGTKSVSFTATATESSCRPTVSATLKDTNSSTTALTGDSSKLVKYKSTAQLVIASTVKNSASIKSVTVNGTNVGTSSSITVNYSNVSTASFTIVVTDSRGYTNTSYVVTPSYVNYIPLTVNAKFFRPQPTTGEVQLTYSGNYFDDSFGTESNSLSIMYRYKTSSSEEWGDYEEIVPKTEENKIKEETISLGTIFDYQTAYDFQLVATDKLTTVTITATVSVGMPVFYWGKDFFNVETNLDLKADGQNIAYKQGGVPILRYNGADATVLAAPENGVVYIRPNGHTDPTGEVSFRPSGEIRHLYGNILTAISLYDNASGTNGTVTLSETAANFTYLDIFYSNNDGVHAQTRLYAPNGKSVDLTNHTAGGTDGGLFIKSKTMYVGGTSMTIVDNTRHKDVALGSNGYLGLSESNYIYIHKVIGYR